MFARGETEWEQRWDKPGKVAPKYSPGRSDDCFPEITRAKKGCLCLGNDEVGISVGFHPDYDRFAYQGLP